MAGKNMRQALFLNLLSKEKMSLFELNSHFVGA